MPGPEPWPKILHKSPVVYILSTKGTCTKQMPQHKSLVLSQSLAHAHGRLLATLRHSLGTRIWPRRQLEITTYIQQPAGQTQSTAEASPFALPALRWDHWPERGGVEHVLSICPVNTGTECGGGSWGHVAMQKEKKYKKKTYTVFTYTVLLTRSMAK